MPLTSTHSGSLRNYPIGVIQVTLSIFGHIHPLRFCDHFKRVNDVNDDNDHLTKGHLWH